MVGDFWRSRVGSVQEGKVEGSWGEAFFLACVQEVVVICMAVLSPLVEILRGFPGWSRGAGGGSMWCADLQNTAQGQHVNFISLKFSLPAKPLHSAFPSLPSSI